MPLTVVKLHGVQVPDLAKTFTDSFQFHLKMTTAGQIAKFSLQCETEESRKFSLHCLKIFFFFK